MSANLLSMYVFTLLIGISVLFTMTRHENRYRGTFIYFEIVFVVTIIATFLEMLSWTFEGIVTPFGFFMNFVSNSLLYVFSVVPLTAWFVYLDYRAYESTDIIKRNLVFYMLPNIIVLVVVVINIWTPVVFSLSEANVFSRGPLAIGIGVMQVVILVIYSIRAYINRAMFDDRIRTVLSMLATFPVIGFGLQALFLGSAFLWPMMMYLVFNAFIIIERDEMLKDVLTNLYTRAQLEHRIRLNLRRQKNFSLVMIDMDELKHINDRFGHEQGDFALKTLANILSSSIRKSDYAYRFAGDEFMIIVESSKEDVSCEIIERIQRRLDFYNNSEDKAYMITMSYGTCYVNASEQPDVMSLFAQVDSNMYDNKFSNKKLKKMNTSVQL